MCNSENEYDPIEIKKMQDKIREVPKWVKNEVDHLIYIAQLEYLDEKKEQELKRALRFLDEKGLTKNFIDKAYDIHKKWEFAYNSMSPLT